MKIKKNFSNIILVIFLLMGGSLLIIPKKGFGGTNIPMRSPGRIEGIVTRINISQEEPSEEEQTKAMGATALASWHFEISNIKYIPRTFKASNAPNFKIIGYLQKLLAVIYNFNIRDSFSINEDRFLSPFNINIPSKSPERTSQKSPERSSQEQIISSSSTVKVIIFSPNTNMPKYKVYTSKVIMGPEGKYPQVAGQKEPVAEPANIKDIRIGSKVAIDFSGSNHNLYAMGKKENDEYIVADQEISIFLPGSYVRPFCQQWVCGVVPGKAPICKIIGGVKGWYRLKSDVLYFMDKDDQYYLIKEDSSCIERTKAVFRYCYIQPGGDPKKIALAEGWFDPNNNWYDYNKVQKVVNGIDIWNYVDCNFSKECVNEKRKGFIGLIEQNTQDSSLCVPDTPQCEYNRLGKSYEWVYEIRSQGESMLGYIDYSAPCVPGTEALCKGVSTVHEGYYDPAKSGLEGLIISTQCSAKDRMYGEQGNAIVPLKCQDFCEMNGYQNYNCRKDFSAPSEHRFAKCLSTDKKGGNTDDCYSRKLKSGWETKSGSLLQSTKGGKPLIFRNICCCF